MKVETIPNEISGNVFEDNRRENSRIVHGKEYI